MGSKGEGGSTGGGVGSKGEGGRIHRGGVDPKEEDPRGRCGIQRCVLCVQV